MGQAKQRGTFEERKALAIARNTAESERRKTVMLERERNMTQKQKITRHNARMILSMGLSNTHELKNHHGL